MTLREGEWVGVDLDCTLALYPADFPDIGPPIAPMVAHVKKMLEAGIAVRIFTARVCIVEGLASDAGRADVAFADDQRRRIDAWCEEHLGQRLPVTAQKDFNMIGLYDDRAIAVEPNTGRILGADFLAAV